MANKKIAYLANNNLENKADDELVILAKQGSEEALEEILSRYKELVNMKVSKYFIIGAEREDNVDELTVEEASKIIELKKENK